MAYFTRTDITTTTYGKELPIVQGNPLGSQLMSRVSDPWTPLVTSNDVEVGK